MAKAPKSPGKIVAPVPRPVESLIHVIRGQKVMLDSDLAALYGVQTFRLNEAVKRNQERFPSDFMLRLSVEESTALTSQFAMSKKGRGGRRSAPYVFTEAGVAMLSSVLNSERAIQMNILIVRAFIRMRELMSSNKEIAARVEKLERGHDRTASVIEVVVEDIDRLAREVKEMKALPPVTRRKIGFILDKD
jgi:ORF6N domain